MGAGFTDRDLKDIREKMDPLIRQDIPFRTNPAIDAPVTWVRPELVCEVRFAEWTKEDVMRQPVFLRMREDKAAREVVREKDLFTTEAQRHGEKREI